MSEKPTILLWIDIETTDASPDAQLLELYAAWEDPENAQSGFVDELYALSLAPPTRKMPPEVTEMHTNSGLLEELKANSLGLLPEDWTDAVLMNLWGKNRRIMRENGAQVTIAGSGVSHFDIPWLRAHKYGDRLVADCTYWHLDVGTLRRTLEAGGLSFRGPDPTPKAHRATQDVMAHRAEYWRSIWALQELRDQAVAYRLHAETTRPKDEPAENTYEGDPQ